MLPKSLKKQRGGKKFHLDMIRKKLDVIALGAGVEEDGEEGGAALARCAKKWLFFLWIWEKNIDFSCIKMQSVNW